MSKKEVDEIAEKFARIDCSNSNSIHRHEVDDLMKGYKTFFSNNIRS
jgi:Ca2+-binding EF-hand superfamily protein